MAAQLLLFSQCPVVCGQFGQSMAKTIQFQESLWRVVHATKGIAFKSPSWQGLSLSKPGSSWWIKTTKCFYQDLEQWKNNSEQWNQTWKTGAQLLCTGPPRVEVLVLGASIWATIDQLEIALLFSPVAPWNMQSLWSKGIIFMFTWLHLCLSLAPVAIAPNPSFPWVIVSLHCPVGDIALHIGLCLQHVLNALWVGLASPHVQARSLKLWWIWWPRQEQEVGKELITLLHHSRTKFQNQNDCQVAKMKNSPEQKVQTWSNRLRISRTWSGQASHHSTRRLPAQGKIWLYFNFTWHIANWWTFLSMTSVWLRDACTKSTAFPSSCVVSPMILKTSKSLVSFSRNTQKNSPRACSHTLMVLSWQFMAYMEPINVCPSIMNMGVQTVDSATHGTMEQWYISIRMDGKWNSETVSGVHTMWTHSGTVEKSKAMALKLMTVSFHCPPHHNCGNVPKMDRNQLCNPMLVSFREKNCSGPLGMAESTKCS